MKNIQLSQDFTLNELIKSNTAKRHGINNIPSKKVVDNLNNLTFYVLQPARSDLGIPIIVTSGYRCPKLNTLIKGSPTSQHMIGEASDIELLGVNNAILFNYIKDNLEFDQLIWEYGDDDEPEWVHVSYRLGNNRNQILRSIKQNGKTKYIEI